MGCIYALYVCVHIYTSNMIGCTILRAVSGILRTQRGRRGSGPGKQLAGATCAGPVRRSWPGAGRHHPWPLRLLSSPPQRINSRPRHGGSTLALVAHHCLSSPPWLSSSPLQLNSLSPGRRRRIIATSHWLWAYSLGCSPACQIAGPYRHSGCRRHRRAVGRARAGTVCGWFADAS